MKLTFNYDEIDKKRARIDSVIRDFKGYISLVDSFKVPYTFTKKNQLDSIKNKLVTTRNTLIRINENLMLDNSEYDKAINDIEYELSKIPNIKVGVRKGLKK